MTVELYDVRSGDVVDTVTVDGTGGLNFATGLARGVADRLRGRNPDSSPDELLKAGWSNGYLATREVPDA